MSHSQRTTLRNTVAAIVGFGMLTVALPASADCDPESDEGAARATKAREMEDEDPARAEELYTSALECGENPVVLFYRGKIRGKLGRLLDARSDFDTACNATLPDDASDSWKKHQKLACAERPAMDQRVPRLKWYVEGATDAQIFVDGEHVTKQPHELDPGEHTIEAKSDDASASKTFTLEENAVEEITLTLEKNAAEEPAAGGDGNVPWSTFAYASFGVAGAGAIVWAAAGGVFLGKLSELDQACPQKDNCNEPELKEDTELPGNVATAGIVVFALGAALGTVFMVLEHTGGDGEEVSVGIGPGGVTTTLRF